MGKSLIIKGADFSLNAIDAIWMEAIPVQGYIVTNPSNPAYGTVELESLPTSQRGILVKILIPAGKSMSVFVNNNGVKITDIYLGYVASQNNVAISQGAVVTSIVANLNPADDSLREDDGSFLLENTTANDLYYYINFSYSFATGPDVLVSGKQVFYKLES